MQEYRQFRSDILQFQRNKIKFDFQYKMGNLTNKENRKPFNFFDGTYKQFRKEGSTNDQIDFLDCITSDETKLQGILDYLDQFMNHDAMEDQYVQRLLSSNISTNTSGTDTEQFQAQRYMAQVNALLTCGFKTPEANFTDLKNPISEKYFTVFEDNYKMEEYRQTQLIKIQILFAVYQLKTENCNSEKTFHSYMQEFFGQAEESAREVLSMQVGFNFVIGILRELQGVRSGQLLIGVLQQLVQSLRDIKPGQLFTNDMYSFKLDTSLNESREFLVQLICNTQSSKEMRTLSYKALLLLGLARNNVEDLLILCNLLSLKNAADVDLRDELRILCDLNLKKDIDKKLSSQVIPNPPMNCYGEATRKLNGQYHIKTGSSNYCVCEGNFQRPLQVEAWLKAGSRGEVSMSLFNKTDSNLGGYCIQTRYYEAYAYNNSENAESELNFSQNDQWHKVVIDAQSNGKVKYQIYHNDKMVDELTASDDKLHVGNLKFFANEQDLYVKDVKIIQTTQGQNEDSLVGQGQDLKVLSNAPVKLLMCSTGDYRINMDYISQMVYDGQYIYVLNSSGLYKISTGQSGKIVAINTEIYHEGDGEEKTSMMVHKNEIYLRSIEQKECINPFQIIDKNSLKIVVIKDEEFYNPPEDVSQNLKWTNDEQYGRSLTFSPTFSDGHYIYVLAKWKPIENDYDEDYDDKLAFKVEQYEPIDGYKQYKFVKDVKLLKMNKDRAFVKEDNSTEWIHSTNWACNGKFITCFSRKDHKLRIFRLDNGKMRQKIETGFSETSQVLYDPQSNQFIHVDEKNYVVEYINFTLKDYFENEQSGIKKVECLELDRLQKLLLEEKQIDMNSNGSQQLDLINQILRGVPNKKVASENSNNESLDQLKDFRIPGVSRALILRFIAQKCSEFDLKFKAVDQQKKDAKTVVGIFRYPLATYLTPYTFNSLRNQLKEGADLLQKPSVEVEVHELHALLNILQVVLANIKALNFCRINISSILYQDYEYKFFMQAFNDCIIKLTKESEAEKKTRIESQNSADKKTIWSNLYEISLDIRQQSINQLSKGEDILNTIKLSLMANKADQVQMHLFHLSQPKNVQSLFKEKMTPQKMRDLWEAFETVISLDRGIIQKNLAQINFLNQDKEHEDQNEDEIMLQQACKSLLQNFAQEVMVRCCQTAQNKQIDETLIYEQLASKVIKTSLQELSAYFDTVVIDLSKVCEETKDWKDMEEKYNSFSRKMSKVFTEQITHYDLSMLFVQSFAIHNPIGQTVLNELYVGTKKVMQSLSHFYYIWQDHGRKLGLGGNMSDIENKAIDDSLQIVIGKLMRHLNWYMGHIAYDLIKFEKEEEGQNNDKAHQRKELIKLVLQSRLLSGGVELRNLQIFSEKTKENIEGYAEIRVDQDLIDQLNQQSPRNEDDNVLEAIICQGKIENVDIAIKFLQLIYETKKPVRIARLGSAAGLRMTRAAFAIMIKFSDLINEFSQLIMAIEIEAQLGDNKAVIEFILKQPSAELIIAKWVSASNMRQWINDQKRILMTKFEKQVEKEVNDKNKGKEMRNDDRKQIDDEAFNLQEKEIENIFDKIQNKALFVIKMSIPKIFKRQDPTKSKELGQLAILRPTDFQPENDPQERFKWELRLKVWKQMQTSKGAIRRFTDAKQEIWNHGITSIIALLQTPISSDEILQQVEQIFVQGCKRATGLKIFNELLKIEKPRLQTNELIQWFCASLRKNENKLTQVLDDIDGQGDYLEQQSRQNFFEILKQLVTKLEKSKNEKEMNQLIQALKWKFAGQEHFELIGINIFPILHQKDIWGKPFSQNFAFPQNQELRNSVLELFEHIFLSIVKRIAMTDEDEDVTIKKSSGQSTLVMCKAKSVIDENISEQLIAQVFDIIFKEIERYNTQIKTSGSFNWQFYTKCKNNKVKLDKSDNEDHESEEISEYGDEVPGGSDKKQKEDDERTEDKEQPSEGENQIESEEHKQQKVNEPSQEEDSKEPSKEEMMQNFTKNIQTREKDAQKTISSLYSETFLKRLLRLLEIFMSVSIKKSKPLEMVRKIANPNLMRKLFELILQGSPSVKIMVLKIVQHFIEIQLPAQIFEDAIIKLQQDKSSFASYLVNLKSDNRFVKFEKSYFLRLLFNYMYLATKNMYDDSKVDSDGMGAVIQNLAVTLRLIMTSKQQSLGINLPQIMREEISRVILEDFDSEQSDALMSLLGGQISGQTAGDFAMTSQRQFVTILGYSSTWKPIDEIFGEDEGQSDMNKKLKKLKITPEFENLDQKAICLFFDKDKRDRQEMISVNPLSLTPVPSLDEQKAIEIARMSPLMNEKVIQTLLSSLEKISLQRQSQILKIICNQIEILGLEFIKILGANSNQWLKIVHRNPVPTKLVEHKLSKMRKIALEGQYQLLQTSKVKIKAKLLKSKEELVFAKIDPKNGRTRRLNAYIESAINLDFVMPGEIDSIKFSKLDTIDSEIMQLFEDYGAIISISPNNDHPKKIDQIFNQVYKEYKNDPKKFPNALHTTVFFISPKDYNKLCEIDQNPESKKMEGVQRVLTDLKEWANMQDDLLLYNVEYENLTKCPLLMRNIIDGLKKEQESEKNILMRKLKRSLSRQHKDKVISKRLDKVDLMKSLLEQNPQPNDEAAQIPIEISHQEEINDKWTSKLQQIKLKEKKQVQNQINIIHCKKSVKFNPQYLQKEYKNGLKQIIDEYWSDCLFKVMQKGKLEEILQLFEKDKVVKYLMVQFNSSVLEMTQMNQQLPYQQAKGLLKQIFQMDNQQFFRQYILQSGMHTLKQYDSQSPDQNYLKSPENLNPYFLRFFTGRFTLMKLSNITSIYGFDIFSNLLTLHLCMICLFQNQVQLCTKLLKSCLKIANFVSDNREKIPQEYIGAFVSNSALRTIVENLKLDEKTKESKFMDSKLLILELYFVIGDLGNQNTMEDDHINLIRRSRQILKENNKLEFVKYLYHLEKLSDEEKGLQNVELKSNTFNGQTSCVVKVDQVDSYEIKFNEDCKLKDFSHIGFGNQKSKVSQTHNGEEQTLRWYSNQLHITQPIQKQCIVGFGNVDSVQLGENILDFKSTQKNNHPEGFNPVQIASVEGYNVAIDKNGDFYEVGQIEKLSKKSEFTKDPKISKVKLVTVSKDSVVVVLEDNTIHCKGNCSFYGKSSSEFQKIEQVKIRGEKLIQLASGPKWLLLLAESGNLWGWGTQLNEWYKDSEPTEAFQIKLPDNTECKEVWAYSLSVPDSKICIIAKLQDRSTGDSAVFSMGNYLLGHQDSTETKEFKKIEAFSSQVIKEISIGQSIAMAIDESGKIWGWGKQEEGHKNGVLALMKEEEICAPVLIKQLNAMGNLLASKISCSQSHVLILYEIFGSSYLYSVGIPDDEKFLHLGFSEKQQVEEKDLPIQEITTFSSQPIRQILANVNSSLVLLEASADPSDYTGYVYQAQDGQYHYQETEFQQDEWPDVCIVLKSSLQTTKERIQKKKWPDLQSLKFEEGNDHNVKCSVSGEDVKGVLYKSRCLVGREEIENNYSAESFKAGQYNDTSPLIFYRLNKKLIEGSEVPVLDLTKFYRKDQKSQLSIKITPDFSTRKNDKLIKQTQEKWDQIEKVDKEFNNKYLQEFQLVINQMIEEIMVKKDKQLEDICLDDLDFEKVTFKDRELQELNDEAKKQKAYLLVLLNKHIKNILPYRCSLLQKMPGSIFQLVSQMRPSMLGCIKNKIIDEWIQSMEQSEREDVNLSRHTAQQFKDSGQCDDNGEYTIFGQIHKKIKQDSKFMKCFQKNSTDAMAFKTYFKGEGSDDYGGPFRECLANMVMEIESDALPLFIKTTNNRTDHGISRECFIPNSSSISPSHESMFKLVGGLIGFNLRTKSALDWHMPPLFWKTLLEDTLGLADLEHIDAYSYQILREIRVNAEQYSPEEFDMAMFENFTTILSNGQTVELQEGGSNIQVNHENHKTFIELVTKVRLSETQKQMNWIKEGINSAIDLNQLSFLTWEELEMRACGKKEISTENLKSITQYEDCYESHFMVKMFWQMFDKLDQDERKKYLKFVWGRSNLPSDTSNLEYKHTIQYLCESDKKDTLPLSHTCFFTIDIPTYSNVDVMLKRVKTAIELCGEIDGDEYMLERD